MDIGGQLEFWTDGIQYWLSDCSQARAFPSTSTKICFVYIFGAFTNLNFQPPWSIQPHKNKYKNHVFNKKKGLWSTSNMKDITRFFIVNLLMPSTRLVFLLNTCIADNQHFNYTTLSASLLRHQKLYLLLLCQMRDINSNGIYRMSWRNS